MQLAEPRDEDAKRGEKRREERPDGRSPSYIHDDVGLSIGRRRFWRRQCVAGVADVAWRARGARAVREVGMASPRGSVWVPPPFPAPRPRVAEATTGPSPSHLV